MANEIKFANTVLEVNSIVVAKVTNVSRSVSVDEEDITGAEDAVAGGDVLRKEFASIAVGETASMEGIAISGDSGQSELNSVAEAGEECVVTHTKPDGTGYTLTGFFTGYEETGSTSEVYKWSGDFRVNSKTEITGS